ncbi:MAG: hypothetical protein GX143_09210 [Alcaligenaceae bacterium]|jgi:flagellin-like hook-associated protein FlgL|nr:hypothetical protein [Alcaligenaceae bacterium]
MIIRTNLSTANIKGLAQAARNTNHGIGMSQTTESELNAINNNLKYICELIVQWSALIQNRQPCVFGAGFLFFIRNLNVKVR